jgi:hypothetical protein
MTKTFTLITGATIALAFASAATSALAVEGTQFVPPTGTLTRAEVKAELAQSQARAGAVQIGDATVFVDTPSSLQRTRLAAQPQPATRVIQVGEATVFIDQPGTRSREDVRAEARAAASSSRGNNTYVGG